MSALSAESGTLASDLYYWAGARATCGSAYACSQARTFAYRLKHLIGSAAACVL